MSMPVYNFISDYYDSLVAKFGDSHKACDYGSEQSQKIKFEVLQQFLPAKDIEVLDVGCGTGEFYSYLLENVQLSHYEGIDLSQSMIDICRTKHQKIPFMKKNILDLDQEFDFVIANGIFYLIQENSIKEMQKIITRMFKLAKKGTAFNSLSAWAPQKQSEEFFADPLQILEFCAKLTPRLTLRHDYLPHDFTIYMYK